MLPFKATQEKKREKGGKGEVIRGGLGPFCIHLLRLEASASLLAGSPTSSALASAFLMPGIPSERSY